MDNVFEGNYWSDWDGIGTYELDKHTITLPVISIPAGGTTLSGVVEVAWTVSVDSFGYSVTYSVYYFNNNGSSWSQLSVGLETNNYTWNTSLLDDGNEYLIMVKAFAVDSFIGLLTVEEVVDSVFTINNTIVTTTTTTTTSENSEADTASGWLLTGILAVFIPLAVNRKTEIIQRRFFFCSFASNISNLIDKCYQGEHLSNILMSHYI